MKKRGFALLLALLMLLGVLVACRPAVEPGDGTASGTGSETETDPVDPDTGVPTAMMQGVNFRISSAKDRKLNIDNLILLLRAMNTGSVRIPVNLTSMLTSSGELKQKQVEQMKVWLAALSDAGIRQVVGYSQTWLFPEGIDGSDSCALPAYDEDGNSDWGRWIRLYEDSWYALATAFPEIRYWEVGSGLNLDANLHPLGYLSDGKTFSTEDKAELIAGMCRAASAGIHRADPEATVILPGIRVDGDKFSTGLQLFRKIYQYITGGFGDGSQDPDDYFDAVAWQYYPDATFLAENLTAGVGDLYRVMQENGDGDKPVFLSEYGMSDEGSGAADTWQAKYLQTIRETVRNDLPCIKGMFFFRLTDDDTGATAAEKNYGLFRVLGKNAFEAKEKAVTLCRSYGGDETLLNQSKDLLDPPDQPTTAEEKIVSYLCTWGRQAYVASKLGISGTGLSEMRDALTASTLFGSKNYYHIIPTEYRSKLIFLLDDGWDVPTGTSQNGSRSEFGSMEPDPVKFGSLGSNAVERLTAMVQKTKELGYAGLGLWVSPQIPNESWTPADSETAREYWETRAKWCAEAGVSYWKVDWGRHQSDTAYRQLITDCAKKYAPDLIVEHAYTQTPFTGSNTDENFEANRRAALKEYVLMNGTIRIYDLSEPFETVCSLDRIDEIFSLYEETGSTADVYVNAESQAYIAAVLGCSLGVMSYNSEMQAALIWLQNYAPAFSAKDAAYLASELTLTDSYYFDRDVADWFSSANRTLTETAPAIMARGCELPEVVTRNGYVTPFVAASVNPITGAASIGCFRRTVDPNVTIAGMADVTFRVGSDTAPIGVFGNFGSLTLIMEDDYSDGVKVLAQDLLGTDAEDISAYVKVEGNRITIDGTVLRRVGRSARTDKDTSDPSLILRISHNS